MKVRVSKLDDYRLYTMHDPRCKEPGQASDSKGRVVRFKNVCGGLTIKHRKDMRVATVVGVKVDAVAQRGALGTKVATALYEKAANDACKIFKVPLASDVARSDNANHFWAKQVKKGRATWKHFEQDAYFDKRAVLTCPAPSSLADYKGK